MTISRIIYKFCFLPHLPLHQIAFSKAFKQFVVTFLLPLLVGTAQAAYKPAFTVLQNFNHFHIHANGSSQQTIESAIRIETERGISRFSERKIDFNSALENVEIIEAYTLQPDGTKEHLTADQIRTQDATSENVSIFSDAKVKLMIYPKVQIGSVLYYKARSHQHTPVFPGHFAWSESYSPFVRHETSEVVITHDPGIHMSFAPRGMQGGPEDLMSSDPPGSLRHRYTFNQTNVVPPESGVIALEDFAPQFAMSSFKNYAEVAQAYQSRAKSQTKVTASISALAKNLTQKDRTVEQKSHTLYNWVSKNIRYVGVYVGAGGFVPHSAQSILDNRYGDCKDHVAILEALLQAVGIESSPALINAGNSHRLPTLATPYAFDHVITYVPDLNLYLDSTAQFAPFGVLPEAVVQQPTLIAATGVVSQTPSVDPQRDYAETHTTLKLQKDGSIGGTSKAQTFGHLQVNSRTSQAQYKDKNPESVVNTLLHRFLESGKGTMTVPDPTDLDGPWVITAEFELDPMVNVPGPSALAIPVGLAPGHIKWISMAPPNLNRKFPDGCLTTHYIEHIALDVPKNTIVLHIPKNVSFKQGNTHYTAQYTHKAKTIHIRRELLLQRPQRFCQPSDEKDWQALTDVMKRDLRAQVFLK